MNESENVEAEETLEDNTEEHEFDGTDEEESTEESEVEDSENLSGDDEGDPEADSQRESRDRAKAQIDRLKDDKKKLQEKLAKIEKEGGVAEPTNSELIERTFLAANGIKDRDIQDEALRLAHKFGIPVDEAMDDADIKGRVETLTKQKQARQSVAKGTGGVGTKTKGVSYYVSYFNQNGDFPAGTSNQMIAKVTDQLAKQ